MSDSWIHTGYTQRVHFGPDAIDGIAEIVKELGARRVMLVTTAGRLRSEAGDRLTRRIGRPLASTFEGTRSHVPTPVVQEAVRQAIGDGVDCLVSFGGGSCADLAKAICFFVEQQSGTPGASYADRPALPHISIPTTYSGAELTPFFGMTDPATGRKTGAGGPTLAPMAAIYDPLLTLDLPTDITTQTAMNALAHGVECAYSPTRSPEAEAVALACIAKVSDALPRVVDEPADLDARIDLLAGAVLGGRCLQNASMGVHHGLAQIVGARTGMPHGLANALILAHALRFNVPAVPTEAYRIGTALGDPDDPAGAVDRLRQRVGLPGGLSECGMDDDDLEAAVHLAADNRNVAANPRPVSPEDARSILEAAW